MRRFAAAAVLLVAGAAPVLGDELPARKAGLWELAASYASRNGSLKVQTCIDAATDQMMLSSLGAFAQSACSGRDVHKLANGFTIDSTCTVGGKTSTVHTAVEGSFDSAYTMTVTSEGSPMPGGALTMSAKWLGPCTAGQKPGDMIMGNGIKLNILEMQKAGPSKGVPLPP
jgi:hypothetical protein